MKLVKHVKHAVKPYVGAVMNAAWHNRKLIGQVASHVWNKPIGGKRFAANDYGHINKKRIVGGGKAAVSVRREAGASTRGSAAKLIKKRKGVIIKKKKNVHVSKDFKAKVQKALDPGFIHGVFQEVDCGGLYMPAGNSTVTQGVSTFNGNGYMPATIWSFDTESILHYASVLFNGVPYSSTNQSWTTPNNLGTGGLNSTATNLIDTKIHVDYMTETYHLKNNCGRTMIIDWYDCAPRKTSTKSISTNSFITGGTISNQDSIANPFDYWVNCLSDDVQNKVNLAGHLATMLYAKPTQLPAWNRQYKANVVRIVLEPGQTYACKVNGPSNFDIDYSSFFSNGVYEGVQKFMRCQMFVSHLDLIGLNASSGGAGGRFGVSFTAPSGYGFICERTRECRLRCPETAGGGAVTAAVGATTKFQNSYHRPAYYRVTNVGNFSGPVVSTKVDEENPGVGVADL